MVKSTKLAEPARFDAGYYRRYYRNKLTRVTSRAQIRRRMEFVGAFCRNGGLKVRSILDAGCGLGLLREPLLEQFAHARYVGLEFSPYLCRRYGWNQGSIVDWPGRGPFDLVICYDVVQYLDSRQAIAAFGNLGRLCSGVLHFCVLTQEDWDLNCEQQHTDGSVHIRPGSWYRRHMAPHFVNAGCGMFVRRGAPLHLWELDRLDSLRRAPA